MTQTYLIRDGRRGWVSSSGPRNFKVHCCTVARALAQEYTCEQAHNVVETNKNLQLKIVRK